MVTWMVGYEERACHCSDDSEHLSNLSYGEPAVASSSSFPSGTSPIPIPVPAPSTSLPASDIPLPSSETSDSDKENSSPGSFKSAQQVVTELVEIQEVDEEEAQVLLDVMDAQVQSRLYQCCKSKNHPSHYHPFPKDWMNGGYVGCQSFQGPSKQEWV